MSAQPSRLGRDLTTREPAAALLAQAAALAPATSGQLDAQQEVAPVRISALRRFFGWLLGMDPPKTARPETADPARPWLLGAAGERYVADVLQCLTRADPLWQSIHSIPVGSRGADIDHLVLGPGGIFTINTKHHPGGKVWVGGDVVFVNGMARPYVRNSRHEAARAARLLSTACGFPVPIRGLVVTVGAALTIKAAPPEVTVLDAAALPRWLSQQPMMLSVSTLGHVHAAARWESSWTQPRT